VKAHRAAALVLLFACAHATAAPRMQESVTSPAGLSRLLEDVRAKNGLPAIGALIVRAEGAPVAAVTGVRKLGSAERAQAGDLWHIGSCTKSMTAALAGLLVDEGTILWETTLAQAFPRLVPSMKPAWREVTLLQLLAHYGGMSSDSYPGGGGRWWLAREPLIKQRAEYTRLSVEAEPQAPPGTRHIYSNRGYTVAGAMLEQAAGAPWEELMRERLWKPLGMVSSGFGAPGDPKRVDQPWGHRRVGGKLEPVPPGPAADNAPVIGPAGTAHCSLQDLGRYIAWVLRAQSGKPAPLSRESAESLFKAPYGGEYALGWLMVERGWAGGTALTHAGSNTMNYCVLWIAPKRGFGIALTTNAGGEESARALDEVAGALVTALAAERGSR
jgi:CubicO group peptidase (beta-lactamase class C family)